MKLNKDYIKDQIRKGDKEVIDLLINHLQESIGDIDSYEDLTVREKRVTDFDTFNRITK